MGHEVAFLGVNIDIFQETVAFVRDESSTLEALSW